jgi:hypothetical protein
VQHQRQLWRAAPHQAEACPKKCEAGGASPPSINYKVLGGEQGGRRWNAKAGLDQPAPGGLFHRGHDAGERHELKRKRIWRRPGWLVAEKRAAERVSGDGERNADQQCERTATSACPRSAIAQRGRAKKRIGDQPAGRTRWRERAGNGLRRGDGGCPQEGLQLGRVSERRWAGVPLGGAPSGSLAKRPKAFTCLRTPLPHSEPPCANA